MNHWQHYHWDFPWKLLKWITMDPCHWELWPSIKNNGKYENNCFTGSWDMSNYVFPASDDLVPKVKGQGKVWPHGINVSCDWIYKCTIEPLEWIHYWNNWHWTLSFSWIWSYWITLGEYKMADISKTRKIWETWMAVLHSSLRPRHFGVPQDMVWKCFTLTYFLTPTDLWPWRSNWGQKVILRIGSSKSICIQNMKTIASLVPEICQIMCFWLTWWAYGITSRPSVRPSSVVVVRSSSSPMVAQI